MNIKFSQTLYPELMHYTINVLQNIFYFFELPVPDIFLIQSIGNFSEAFFPGQVGGEFTAFHTDIYVCSMLKQQN